MSRCKSLHSELLLFLMGASVLTADLQDTLGVLIQAALTFFTDPFPHNLLNHRFPISDHKPPRQQLPLPQQHLPLRQLLLLFGFRGCAVYQYTQPIFIVSVGVPPLHMACQSSTILPTPPDQTMQQHLNSISTTVLLLPTAKDTLESSGSFNFPACRFSTQPLAASVPNGFPPRSSHPIFFPIVHIYSLRLQTSQITTNLQMPRTGPPTTILQPRQQGQPITTSALTASQEQFFVVATAI
jgi:hypothetical protein